MKDLVYWGIAARLLMFTLRKFPVTEYILGGIGKGELLECDFCLGFWSHLLTYPFFGVGFGGKKLNSVWSSLGMSFLTWVFGVGWDTLFREVSIK